MGKSTLLDEIKGIIWNEIEAPIFMRVLKRHDLDFGDHWLDELIAMYKRHKDEISK